MHRSAILTASLLSAFGLVYVGCTQNFDQFEPVPTGAGSSVSASSGGEVGGAGGSGQGGQGGVGGGTVTSSSSTGGGTCMKPSDCGMDTACVTWTCKMGMCESMMLTPGTPTTDPTPGDCSILACNANGAEVPAINNGDKPDDMNDCTVDDCNAGTPTHTNVAAGTNCTLAGGGMGKCNDMGMCLDPNACTVDGDCKTGLNPACVNGQCVACDDAMKNGDETGVDCGGTHCGDCNGDTCAAGPDCASGFCADGVCCNAACDAACKACNIAGNVGTCSNVPLLQDDTTGAMTCMGTMTCDGQGTCKLDNGQACTNGNQCATGKCPNNQKTCQP